MQNQILKCGQTYNIIWRCNGDYIINSVNINKFKNEILGSRSG